MPVLIAQIILSAVSAKSKHIPRKFRAVSQTSQ